MPHLLQMGLPDSENTVSLHLLLAQEKVTWPGQNPQFIRTVYCPDERDHGLDIIYRKCWVVCDMRLGHESRSEYFSS